MSRSRFIAYKPYEHETSSEAAARRFYEILSLRRPVRSFSDRSSSALVVAVNHAGLGIRRHRALARVEGEPGVRLHVRIGIGATGLYAHRHLSEAPWGGRESMLESARDATRREFTSQPGLDDPLPSQGSPDVRWAETCQPLHLIAECESVGVAEVVGDRHETLVSRLEPERCPEEAGEV